MVYRILSILVCLLICHPVHAAKWMPTAYAFPRSVYTEKHYVTESGGSPRDGESLATAWSVADFNLPATWSSNCADDGLIGPGDIVYFDSSGGVFTSPIVIPGSGAAGQPIVLDGLESGDFDPWGGGTSNAIFTGGMLFPGGTSYITVQDFRGAGGSSTTSNNIMIVGEVTSPLAESHITIQRNYLYNPDNLTIYTIRSSAGEKVNRSTYLTIRDNRLINLGGTVNAQCSLNIYNQDNFVVERNEVGYDGVTSTQCTSANIIEVHTSQHGVIQNNNIYGAPQQSGIELKEHGNQYVVVRFNRSHNNGLSVGGTEGYGISAGDVEAHHLYIYGNLCHENRVGNFRGYYGLSDSYYWSNLSYSCGSIGFILFDYDGSNPPDGIIFAGNTLYGDGVNYAGSEARTSLYLFRGINITLKNNIMVDFRPGDTSAPFYALYESLSSNPVLERNQYYHDGDALSWYWDGSYINLSTLQAAGREINASITNPSFVNPSLGTAAGFRPTAAATGENLAGTLNSFTIQGVTFGEGQLDLGYQIDSSNTNFFANPVPIVVMIANPNNHTGAVAQ